MARGLVSGGFGTATPINRGLFQRFTDGVNGQISTINPMSWMGPAQPIRRVAPAGTQARIWDYRFGQNIDYTPKGYEGYCFDVLRDLADGYDLLRMVIETRKDQVSRVPHSFKNRQQPGEPAEKLKERNLSDKRIAKLDEFFSKPDGVHSFSDWQRMILEDMFVIDAPAIAVRWRRDGGIYGFDAIDGATISLLVDENGRAPMPPDPAYRQIIKGMPAVDMMIPDPTIRKSDQLFYMPRNARTKSLYGYSPVEQVVMSVNIGLRRQISQLQYYSEGTIPDVFLEAPEGLSEDRFTQFEAMWNEKFASTAARRKANFIPHGTTVTFAKDPKLKDEMDEYLARKIAYAFSVSPTALVKMVNRACYAEDTETLTENGWKFYRYIGEAEKIGTVNPNTGALEYHLPTQRFVYPHSGEMVSYKNRNVDILVTPEHQMWGREYRSWRGLDEYKKFPANKKTTVDVRFMAAVTDFKGEERDTFEIKGPGQKFHLADYDGCTVKMDDWLEFLGYYLSEGGLSHNPPHYLLTLSQKDKSNAAKIEACLGRLPFGWKRYPEQSDGMTRWNVYGKPVWTYLIENAGGYCYDKRIPREFMGLSRRQLQILFDAMMLGDGSVDQRVNCTGSSYPSVSQQLCSDVQEVAFKLGKCASMKQTSEKRVNRHKGYRVSMCDREEHHIRRTSDAAGRKPHLQSEQYEGMVYCFEVPNHLFVTRRNGKIAIQGNSGQQMSEDARAEGLEPILFWWKEVMDDLLAFMGCADIEYANGQSSRENPLLQAQVAQIYLSTVDDQGHSVMRASEVREDLGLDAIDYEAEDEADFQKQLDQTSQRTKQQQTLQANDPNQPDDSPSGQDQQRRQQQTQEADSPRPKAAQLADCPLCRSSMKIKMTAVGPRHVDVDGTELLCYAAQKLLASRGIPGTAGTAQKKKAKSRGFESTSPLGRNVTRRLLSAPRTY
jgi:hypothetical protein